jgi:hypothetical protein
VNSKDGTEFSTKGKKEEGIEALILKSELIAEVSVRDFKQFNLIHLKVVRTLKEHFPIPFDVIHIIMTKISTTVRVCNTNISVVPRLSSAEQKMS